MPKHTATVEINASPDKVWAIVSDGARLTEWLTPVRGVDSVDPQGPLKVGSQIEATLGKAGGAQLRIKEAQQGRRLRWAAGPAMAHMMRMPMHVELDLEPRGESTAATITFKANPMIAPLMKMMSGLNLGAEAPNTVQKLKQVVEAG